MRQLLIPKNKTALLQTVRDSLNKGYIYWTCGEIRTLKAESLCEKFDELYGVLNSKHQNTYKLSLGKASTHLFMYPRKSGDMIDWILLATKGTGLIHEKEKLKCHTSGQRAERFAWQDYEIVTLNNRMTWRLSKTVAEQWEKKVVAAARKSDPADLLQTIQALSTYPMFTGVREQVKSILQKARKTRIRHHIQNTTEFAVLPYLRRIKVYDDPPMTLTKFVDIYQAQLKTESPKGD